MNVNRLLCLLGVLPWLTLPGSSELADSEVAARIALTYPDQAVRFVAVLPGNSLRVVAHDEPTVEVRWLDQPAYGEAVSIRLSEDRNEVELEVGSKARDRELEIAVPRDTSLSIKNEEAGSVYVEGLRGDQEIESRYGDIRLRRASGSAVLAAYHGSLKASFVALDATRTHSFITYRGDIDLQLPADVGATFSLTLNTVRVESDFTLERVGERGPSRHVIGDGRARIDITMNRGELRLRGDVSP